MQFMPDILPATSESIWSKRVVATSLKIGFLGLGTMGSAIVSNLLKSGHEVTIWNRTVAKVIISACFQPWTFTWLILKVCILCTLQLIGRNIMLFCLH